MQLHRGLLFFCVGQPDYNRQRREFWESGRCHSNARARAPITINHTIEFGQKSIKIYGQRDWWKLKDAQRKQSLFGHFRLITPENIYLSTNVSNAFIFDAIELEGEKCRMLHLIDEYTILLRMERQLQWIRFKCVAHDEWHWCSERGFFVCCVLGSVGFEFSMGCTRNFPFHVSSAVPWRSAQIRRNSTMRRWWLPWLPGLPEMQYTLKSGTWNGLEEWGIHVARRDYSDSRPLIDYNLRGAVRRMMDTNLMI